MLNSCLSWAQSLSHRCRFQYAGPAQQCVADSSALGVAAWWLRRAVLCRALALARYLDKGTLQRRCDVQNRPREAGPLSATQPHLEGAPTTPAENRRRSGPPRCQTVGSRRWRRFHGQQLQMRQNDLFAILSLASLHLKLRYRVWGHFAATTVDEWY